jgi:hypothetical protein
MDIKKIILIVTGIFLLAIIGIWISTSFITPTCFDDSGPMSYFYKKDMTDVNLDFLGFSSREDEIKINNFMNNNTPIATSDSYCGTNESYKILKNNSLTNVSKNEFYEYLLEQNTLEEIYSIQYVAGQAMINKFRLWQ